MAFCFAWLWPAFDSLKRKRLVRLAWPSSPRSELGKSFFCALILTKRKTVATQPLRGCHLRTPKKCKRFFGLACRHLHLTHHKGRFFFALYAKRLLRNLCVGCHLRTPRERPTAFRPIACCLQNNDRFVPKPLRFKCLRILPLFCVLYARRKNASAFSA